MAAFSYDTGQDFSPAKDTKFCWCHKGQRLEMLCNVEKRNMGHSMWDCEWLLPTAVKLPGHNPALLLSERGQAPHLPHMPFAFPFLRCALCLITLKDLTPGLLITEDMANDQDSKPVHMMNEQLKPHQQLHQLQISSLQSWPSCCGPSAL